MRILIADDYELVRTIHRNNFRKMGIEDIDEAADGFMAVKAAAETQYNLIMMDCYMPKMNGVEAIEAIRATGNRTPIVFCTDEVSEDVVDMALRTGANKHLAKPYTPKQFREMMRKLLRIPPES